MKHIGSGKVHITAPDYICATTLYVTASLCLSQTFFLIVFGHDLELIMHDLCLDLSIVLSLSVTTKPAKSTLWAPGNLFINQAIEY